MKLYPRLDQTSVQEGDELFELGEDGTIEVPHELGEKLHRTHIGGRQAWETESEKHARELAEEAERRRDPDKLYGLVADLRDAQAKGVDVDKLVAEAVEKAVAETTAKFDAVLSALL